MMKDIDRVKVFAWIAMLGGCGERLAGPVPELPETPVVQSALTAADVEPLAPPAPWSGTSTKGTHGTFVVDVTGDGRADVVGLNGTSITVFRTASSFFTVPPETWLSSAFVGTRGNLFADVTGDGAADAIELNDTNVIVRPSVGGNSFGAAQTWSGTAFFGNSGSSGTFAADVDGDKKADLIAVNVGNIQVRRSTGSGLGAVQTWASTAFLGGRGNWFADVTGDGRVDAIKITSSTVTVRRSTGTAFNSTDEIWSSSFSGGSKKTAFEDVTGDGTADAVAVDQDGVVMQRSGRWFFGRTERLSSVLIGANRQSLVADVTGDGRADVVNTSSTLGTEVEVRQDREIPLRVVQLMSSCGNAASDDSFAPLLADANATYRELGLKFVLRQVDQNPDCPGQASKSHIVLSPELSDFADAAGPTTVEVLAKAKDPFNSSCNIGYDDIKDMPEGAQFWWVASRCALPGEVLIYVSHPGTNLGTDPGDGNVILLERWGAFDVANGSFSHELGHYLGLPHSFSVFSAPLSYIDPSTGQGAPMSAYWDLVQANGNQFFDRRTDAAAQEMQLAGIENGGTGWFCPSGDPNRPCPFSSLPGGNPPPATLGMPVSGNLSNVIHTYLPQTTTFDRKMKGIAPRIPGNTPAINTMSYSYPPMDAPNLKRAVSLSQIEVIQNVLSTDVRTKYLDATGHVIFGRRPSLGITAPAPQIRYQQTPLTVKLGRGTLASNGQNTWMIGTQAASSGGNRLFEWNYRTRGWTAKPGGAYKIALPPDGWNYPWIITNSLPGPVKRWDGSAFVSLPADPNGACANSIAVGTAGNPGNPTGSAPLWVASCVGNGDGNFKLVRYTDANGWQWPAGAGEAWGVQIAVDWSGAPWITTQYAGGSGVTINRAVLGSNGLPTAWIQVPPPSGVVPVLLSGGALNGRVGDTGWAQGGSRLPVNFLGSDGHIYIYNANSTSWVDAGAPPFAVGGLAGAMPYLWLQETNGHIWYTY